MTHAPRRQALTEYRSSAGRRRASTKLACTTLRAMLNAAIDDGVIAVNPTNRVARGVGLGKSRDEGDVRAFTRDQVNLFLNTARREAAHYFPIFLTL